MALTGLQVHVSGFQVDVRSRSGSRLLMSPTAESESCDYFGVKVQINPVWVTTLLI